MSAVAAAGTPALPVCPHCGDPVADLAPGHFVKCNRCATLLLGQVFPALAAAAHQPIQSGERAMEGDAVCFFHAGKRAELSCSRCGRFICSLCEMPIGSERVCPTCLAGGLENGKMEELVPRRVVWGQLALITGLLPLLSMMWPFWIITAPAAIGLAIYGWNQPGSLVRGRRRFAAFLGLLLGCAQLGILGVIVYAIRDSF